MGANGDLLKMGGERVILIMREFQRPKDLAPRENRADSPVLAGSFASLRMTSPGNDEQPTEQTNNQQPTTDN
jgi:hypothetical protein